MAEENNNIPQQPRACPRDCRLCSQGQQLYCSTHMVFMLHESVKKLNDRLDVIEDSILSMQHEQDDELITPDTPDISEYQ